MILWFIFVPFQQFKISIYKGDLKCLYTLSFVGHQIKSFLRTNLEDHIHGVIANVIFIQFQIFELSNHSCPTKILKG